MGCTWDLPGSHRFPEAGVTFPDWEPTFSPLLVTFTQPTILAKEENKRKKT
jgi:hypothetical protein